MNLYIKLKFALLEGILSGVWSEIIIFTEKSASDLRKTFLSFSRSRRNRSSGDESIEPLTMLFHQKLLPNYLLSCANNRLYDLVNEPNKLLNDLRTKIAAKDER